MKSKSRRRAVTMIELLIVIAVVAFLAGLLVVSIQNARTVAARTRCANNMRNIGIAYNLYVDAKAGSPAKFRPDLTWAGQLMPYVQNEEDVFRCISEAAPKTVEGRIPTVGPSDPVDLAIYSHVLKKNISLMSQGTIHHQSGSVGVPEPVGEPRYPAWSIGSFNVELNWQNVPEFLRPGENGRCVFVVASPFADAFPEKSPQWWAAPYSMILYIEPVPTHQEAGNVQISIYRKFSDPNAGTGLGETMPNYIPPKPRNPNEDGADIYDLVRPSTGAVVIEDFLSGRNPQFKPFRPNYVILSGDKGTQRPKAALPLVMPDYGVNAKAAFFSPMVDSGKVLALEYNKAVAKVVGTDNSELTLWPKLAAPRHNGVLNVLYKGGHVQAMNMKEIDPGFTDIHWEHWLPTKLRR